MATDGETFNEADSSGGQSGGLDASGVPDYLSITHTLVRWINEGSNPVEAVVTAFAELEKFVRSAPTDPVVLDIGPRDAVPITKDVVGRMENFAYRSSGEVSYGLAAIQRLGVLVRGICALEVKTQELERRIVELGDGGLG